ncbi:hypothetical protein MPH_10781 [Macrophomina phaseolina MS6]|uniref:Uncharacterized protein n=1 Tax=Macrophomina phaseolina (strain MS6) TaxID=1126212 RepID=K2S5X0_MACPH|nr:hypothetical protein MPH_10781 [Macrophomina phaseolina MS6]
MAVSPAHQQAEVGARVLEVSDGSRERFMLRQYNKAIARLSEQEYDGPQPSCTLLLTCVLFVCLEFLRGDTNMAMGHTLNGLIILNSWQADVAKQKQKGYSDYQRNEEDFTTENLTPIFCRLSVISTLLGKPTPTVQTRPPSMDRSEPSSSVIENSFRTLDEARDALIDIQNSGLRFMWATMEKKYQGTITMTEILEQVRLEMRLAEWHRALDKLEGQLAQRPKDQLTAQAVQAEEDSLIILRLLHTVAHIWLSSCLSLKESAFDAFLAEFQQINALAARLLSRLHSSSSTSFSSSAASFPPTTSGAIPGDGANSSGNASSFSFSFETELVGPLYFTAIKCREPVTRRQTLALLDRCGKREGAIDSSRASQLATAIMQIEEAGMQMMASTASTAGANAAAANNPQNHQQPHPPSQPPSSSTRLDTAAMFSSASSLPPPSPLPPPRTSTTPSHPLLPDSTRIAHAFGLPTSSADGRTSAAMPLSVSPRESVAKTAARLPAEGNRIGAYYEPVMLPNARELPAEVQTEIGVGSALEYMTTEGVFRREGVVGGRGGGWNGLQRVEGTGAGVGDAGRFQGYGGHGQDEGEWWMGQQQQQYGGGHFNG